ncbi:MAG: hypothetical protein Ct9H300mP25_04530 [Acidobacteriota bacterium]|nr:MAG: hypothetical protein Ct9H300mP25_04530 [Acidobacteriota bacterium]
MVFARLEAVEIFFWVVDFPRKLNWRYLDAPLNYLLGSPAK